ncbi:EAL domain-containing protein [Parahaliea sp. F7430]|uniref:EAL domain-containing protein n=1 Tax=Sediminihaliea albiluteola TaxID=2758564 RepID=A0A7W2TYL4_9GAMM|nr:EAL domain-containing protein [Sediminihaliea albiluteola]MBA6414369.1 EAL domain-containing protein [Sediminihaliea albiluteola]
MSLFKQLWLAFICILTLVFGASFVVSSLSTKHYLEQQLFIKNSDNASALALSLSQQDADPVLLELTLAAQFDTGHYQKIELVDPEGKLLLRREDTDPITEAPQWFINLLPLEVSPGIAQIQQGWQQLGTLSLYSHSRFAYQELWKSSQQLALVFLAAILLSGLISSYLLSHILRPLGAVVSQAKAIGERRFITIEEPRTKEFRQVSRAMNTLSQRVQQALHKEAARLEKWRRDSQIDGVTSLLSREAFMQNLASLLENDNDNASGTLSLVRLEGLAELNQRFGHSTIDELLGDIGSAIRSMIGHRSDWQASRLNGSEFALIAPRTTDPESVATKLLNAISGALEARNMRKEVNLPCASTSYAYQESPSQLLTRLDSALITASREDSSTINVIQASNLPLLPVRDQISYWKNLLEQAFKEQKFSLDYYPVVDRERKLMHLEAPARLLITKDERLSAAVFLPWIKRLKMSAELDQHIIDLALKHIAVYNEALCINLSAGALIDPNFPLWLSTRLESTKEHSGNLWLELPEPAAFRHLEAFKRLTARVKVFGCKVGVEHVGHQLANIGQLHDLGLDYLKVDAFLIRDIDSNPANQTLLRTLCTVGHSIGLSVIAEGVRNLDEWHQLEELGIDGCTGPGVTKFSKLS